MEARERFHIQLMSHNKHMNIEQSSCATENLSYITRKFVKSITTVDLHISFTDMRLYMGIVLFACLHFLFGSHNDICLRMVKTTNKQTIEGAGGLRRFRR